MIKDLVKVANRLDSLGLVKEADVLDGLILRLARDLGAEAEIKDYKSEYPAPNGYNNSFEWPWEVWAKLPEAVRTDWYDLLNKLSWIPILGVGPLSAKFVLNCFERKWSEAAVALCFIILNFCFVLRYAGQISLLKRNLAEMALRSAVADLILNGFNEIADKVNETLSSTTSFGELAAQFDSQRSLIKNYIDSEIDRYLV